MKKQIASFLGFFMIAIVLYISYATWSSHQLHGENVNRMDLGIGGVSEKLSVSVHIYNEGNTLEHVVGLSSSCSCSSTTKLPISIPVGGHVEIAVEHERPNKPGPYLVDLTFFLKGGSRKVWLVQLQGEVENAQKSK